MTEEMTRWLQEELRKAPGRLYVTDLRLMPTPFGPMLTDPVNSLLRDLESTS